MIREIKAMGFEIDCVLADSLYGESTSTFIRFLQELNLQEAVAIRSNHSVRLPPEQRVRANKWRKFERIFSDESREVRYIRGIIGVAELRYDLWGQGMFWLPDLPRLRAIEIIGWIGHRNIPKLKIMNY
jgi:SRSO17 transposase